MEDIHTIYDKLGDEISKEIFINRLAFNMTGDRKWILNIIKIGGGGEVSRRIDQAIAEGRELCIFGAGIWGNELLDSYSNIEFSCFIDNNREKYGKRIKELPVISFNEWIEKSDNSVAVISSKLYHKEQYAQLIEHKIPEERIINAGEIIDYLETLQYFDLPKFKELQAKDEVFVDAGAFDGKTSARFAQWTGETYKKIYAMEPEPDNRGKCNETLNALGGQYEVLPFGAWNESGKLFFSANKNGASHIIDEKNLDENTITISVNKMDDLIHEKVSFIKMDIEGAELKALCGAEHLIKTYKPKLAICVYHRKEDIIAIPKLILSYVPEYKFYLRHYSLNEDEEVLYGVVE